jgi:hypothetical protein
MTAPVGSGDFAERMLRRFLLLCEHPRTSRRVLALVRGSVADAATGRRFYALVNRVVLHPLARAMRLEASAVRIELVGSQLIGLAMLRYVLEVEPVASLDVDELVSMMAPALRQSLARDRDAAPALPVCSCASSEPLPIPW